MTETGNLGFADMSMSRRFKDRWKNRNRNGLYFANDCDGNAATETLLLDWGVGFVAFSCPLHCILLNLTSFSSSGHFTEEQVQPFKKNLKIKSNRASLWHK